MAYPVGLYTYGLPPTLPRAALLIGCMQAHCSCIIFYVMLHPLHSSCPPFLIYCLWWMPLYFFVLGHLFTELFIVLLIDANLLINYFPTLFSLNKDSKFLGFNSVSIRAYFWSPKHACLFQRTENMVSLDSKIDPPYCLWASSIWPMVVRVYCTLYSVL